MHALDKLVKIAQYMFLNKIVDDLKNVYIDSDRIPGFLLFRLKYNIVIVKRICTMYNIFFIFTCEYIDVDMVARYINMTFMLFMVCAFIKVVVLLYRHHSLYIFVTENFLKKGTYFIFNLCVIN